MDTCSILNNHQPCNSSWNTILKCQFSIIIFFIFFFKTCDCLGLWKCIFSFYWVVVLLVKFSNFRQKKEKNVFSLFIELLFYLLNSVILDKRWKKKGKNLNSTFYGFTEGCIIIWSSYIDVFDILFCRLWISSWYCWMFVSNNTKKD